MNSFIRAISFTLLCLSPCYQHICAQSMVYSRETVKQHFEYQVTNVHQEKIFIHVDRNSYITGETIWLSAYCVDAANHIPVDVSKVLNIELLDATGQAVKQIRIKLSAGFGKGQIFVSPDLQSGHYVLRAYTNWMKNFDTDFIFKQHLKIVNPSSIRETGVTRSGSQPVIQFFPEGGQLVAGLRSKVAVKASDGFGNGMSLTGIIYDNEDNEVTEFTTSKLGYTYFFLTPGTDKITLPGSSWAM